ncbi:restriction endonuclease subunit S [Salinisphaera hydrothermalis]|uniref:restriction endonuclease subunit S n=1 Tax=Salinisphaera hydrothermalis TaxID=563188 RepID=UPI0033411217
MLDLAKPNPPTLEGYKETKIGPLPEDWQVMTLEEITEPSAPIRYGVVQIGPDTPDGIPIVPIKHIRRIGEVSLHRTSPKIEGRYKGSRVTGGDVLLSVKGTIGEVGVVPDGFEGNIARELARIRPQPCCDSHFLSLQLQAPATQRRIDKLVVGSTRLEFSIHAVRDFLVVVPPISVQQKIAEILRTWDEGLKKLTNLRTAKECYLRGITRILLDRTIEHAATKIKPLSKLARVVKGKQLNKLDIAGGDYPVWNGGITPSGWHNEWNTQGGTITISEGGNSCGFVNLASKRFWLGGHCYAVHDLSPQIAKDFLLHALKARESEIMRLRVGSGLPNIQRADLEKLKIVIPPIAEQKRIARALTVGRRELSLIDEQINVLTRQKRGLMQKLFREG